MKFALLIIIYLVFISLGLPDGVLGSGWPAIHTSLSAPIALGGLLTVVGLAMTTTSSLLTTQLVRRLGVRWVVTISVLLTSLGLLGISQANHIAVVFLFAIPLGLGGGAIDSSLNHYVSHNYKAHHMNWLHAFWGAGAMLGPLIFAAALTASGGWKTGFFALGAIQFAIVIVLLCTLRLWEKEKEVKFHIIRKNPATILQVLQKKLVRLSALAFLLYVGLEVIVGFWLASYLVSIQEFSIETAAVATSLYFGAIMVGRLVTGALTFSVSSASLVRYGILLALVGVIVLGLHISTATSLLAVLLIGLGFAPVYPNLIHATPSRFKKESSQVMSIQMATGHLGAGLFSPLIGVLEMLTGSLAVFIFVLLAGLAGLLWAVEMVRAQAGEPA